MKLERHRRCRICAWAPPGGLDVTLLNLHHVVPRAAGGGDLRTNLILLCPNHHAVVHALWPLTDGRYEGPRTPRDLVVLVLAFEKDPSAYCLAKGEAALSGAFSGRTGDAPDPEKETGGPE